MFLINYVPPIISAIRESKINIIVGPKILEYIYYHKNMGPKANKKFVDLVFRAHDLDDVNVENLNSPL